MNEKSNSDGIDNGNRLVELEGAIAAGKALLERTVTVPNRSKQPSDTERAIAAGIAFMEQSRLQSPIQPGSRPEKLEAN